MITIEQTKGRALIFFAGWVLFLILGLVLRAVYPESMEKNGQLGDFFGIANSLIAFFTAVAAVVNIRYLSEQIKDQRVIAAEQKKQEMMNIQREKLERIVMGLRSYMEISVGSMSVPWDSIDSRFHTQYVRDCVEALRDAEILVKMYFSGEIVHKIGLIMEENSNVIAIVADIAKWHNVSILAYSSSYSKASPAINKLGKRYNEFLNYVLENNHSIIVNSPAVKGSSFPNSDI